MANSAFEGIAKTNTTNTGTLRCCTVPLFEGIAKTNTTNTKKIVLLYFRQV